MRKLGLAYLFVFLLLLLGTMVKAENSYNSLYLEDIGRHFILNLPYKINEGITSVFEEHTPLALDITEIKLDGYPLYFIDDIRPLRAQGYWKSVPVNPGQDIYYISMYWDKIVPNNLQSIRWNDGKGLYFTRVYPVLSQPNTNSYKIERGSRYLQISYRVQIPENDMPEQGLYMFENEYTETYLTWDDGGLLNRKDAQFSSIYTVTIDLSNIWE